jgi:hypothetical protein
MGFNNWEKEEAPQASNLHCMAHNCPMEWTVDTGSRLCSYHAWAAAREWPSITSALIGRQHLGTLPTFAKAQNKQIPPSGITLSTEQKRDAVLGLKRLGSSDPRAWAKRLQARENAGEHLSKFQADAWRQALR